MLKRFLVFLIVGALLAAFGVLFYLNPGAVEFHLPQGRVYSLPLPLLLLLSFFVGAILVFVLALVRETQWSLARRRQRRSQTRIERKRGALDTGRDLLWHDRPGEARSALRSAAGADDGIEPAALFAETALADAGGLSEARAVLEDALARHPEHPRLLALLAEVQERSGDRTTASHVIERAIAQAPQSRRLAARLRDLYVAEERWPEALRAEQHLLGLLRRPDEILREGPLHKGIRCEAALALADADAVVTELRALHYEDPAFVPSAVALGDRLRATERLREAIRVWMRTARRRPLPALLGRIEAACRELGRPKKVLALYRRLRRRSDAPWLLFQHVRFLLGEGEIAEAERLLGAERERLGDSTEFQALEGEIHRLRGHTELAVQAFRLALDPIAAERRSYLCHACMRSFPAWAGRCPGCGAFDSLEA